MNRASANRLLLILAGLWLVAAPANVWCKSPKIKITGNRVLIDEVYRAVLKLPPGAKADAATARQIQGQVLGFLRKAGYVLATVDARVDGEAIHLRVDEGQLEKVLFLGSGTLKTLRLKLDLNLPHNVFNRPNLVRQLRYLGKRYGVSSVTYRLVPSKIIDHAGPQIGGLGDIQGRAVIPPSGKYELHILFGRSEWDTGLGLDLEYNFPDGLVLGAHYQGMDMLFSDDRWRVGIQVGAEFREPLEGGDPYLALSRAEVEAKWYTPALVGRGLRPYIWLRSELHSRQRGDLDIETYYRELAEGSLNIGYEFVPGLMASAGGGAQGKFLFDVDQLEGSTFTVEEVSQLRPFILGKIEVIFNPGSMRRDRRHQLVVEGRHFWLLEDPSFGKVSIFYQKVFEFGWHDLWVKARGAWLWGEVAFDDEEPVGGRYLRGIFGGSYAEKVAGVTAEFRLSLLRDLFKVSLFNDFTVFGELDRTVDDERLRVGDSFGLGFHALILDTFQFDIYYSFGFNSAEDFDHGPSAGLKKVF